MRVMGGEPAPTGPARYGAEPAKDPPPDRLQPAAEAEERRLGLLTSEPIACECFRARADAAGAKETTPVVLRRCRLDHVFGATMGHDGLAAVVLVGACSARSECGGGAVGVGDGSAPGRVRSDLGRCRVGGRGRRAGGVAVGAARAGPRPCSGGRPPCDTTRTGSAAQAGGTGDRGTGAIVARGNATGSSTRYTGPTPPAPAAPPQGGSPGLAGSDGAIVAGEDVDNSNTEYRP